MYRMVSSDNIRLLEWCVRARMIVGFLYGGTGSSETIIDHTWDQNSKSIESRWILEEFVFTFASKFVDCSKHYCPYCS